MSAQEFRRRAEKCRAFADEAVFAATKHEFTDISKRWDALAVAADDAEYQRLVADALTNAERTEDPYSART
jgi:hypothetical protein